MKGMAFLYFHVIDRERLILLSSKPRTARDIGAVYMEGGDPRRWNNFTLGFYAEILVFEVPK